MVNDKSHTNSANLAEQEFRTHQYSEVLPTSTDSETNDDGIRSKARKVEAEALRLSLLPAWMGYEKLLRITATEIQQGGVSAMRSAAGFERHVEQSLSNAIERYFPLSDADIHYSAVTRIEAVLMLLYDKNNTCRLAAAGVNSHQPGGNPAVLRRLVQTASWFPIDADGRLPSGTLDHVLRDPSDDKRDRVPPKPLSQRQMPFRFGGNTNLKNTKRNLPRNARAHVLSREHIGRQWRYLPLLRRTVDPNLVSYIGKRMGKITIKGLWGENPEYWVVRCVCGVYELRSRPEVSGRQQCRKLCSQC